MQAKQRVFRANRWARRSLALLLTLVIGLGLAQPALAVPVWQIQAVGSASGQYASLALDSSGNPVISYYDATNADLKLVHCGDATCSTANTLVIVDSTGTVGGETSLALNSSGNPVISYFDSTNQDLKLVQCGNSSCSSGNTITTVDSTGYVGRYPSLELDSSGNPVISYWDVTNFDLKLVKCGDATCSSGNLFQTVDSTGSVGSQSSLALDSNGNPVISYYDGTNTDLKLATCGNATCSSGNTILTVDTAGSVGQYSALALRSGGAPMISYYDATNGDLKVFQCGNATCSSGNTIQTLDSTGDVGQYTSLVLGSNGNPQISYYDVTNLDLKVFQCGNATCSSGNSSQTLDSTGDVGRYTTLVLDSSGNPVISYLDNSSRGLKIARLVGSTSPTDTPMPPTATPTATTTNTPTPVPPTPTDTPMPPTATPTVTPTNTPMPPTATPTATPTNTPTPVPPTPTPTLVIENGNWIVANGGRYSSLALDSNGNPVISYYEVVPTTGLRSNTYLKLVQCGNPTCSSINIQTLDRTYDSNNFVGKYTSLVLDSNGNPVISYYAGFSWPALKLVRCHNPICSAKTIQTVDSAGTVGLHSSLALDSNGNPVISYFDSTNRDLKLVHCGDPTCSSGNVFQVVDDNVDRLADASRPISLALDSSGNPVISYYAGFSWPALKLVRCGNPTCSSGNTMLTVDSVGDVGRDVSLALDSNGNAVISYFDQTNGFIKLAHCGNPTCTAGGQTVAWGLFGYGKVSTSLALDSRGYPIISYYDEFEGDLMLVRCGNAICSSANFLQRVDRRDDVGQDSSLKLDSNGNPVISYYDYTNGNLKLARPGPVPPGATPIPAPPGPQSPPPTPTRPPGAWLTDLDGTTTLNPQDYPAFCLNLHGNVTSDGATVNLWRCNGSTSQQWVRYLDLTIRPKDYPAYCLDLQGNVASNGATISLKSCSNNSSQMWNADANHNLHPLNYFDFCLNLHDNTASNGATINLWTCNGHNSQKWNVSAAPAPGAWLTDLDGTTNLSPQDYPGYCLNLQGNVGSNGTAINLWTCTGHNSQKWVRYADKTLRPQDYSAFCLNLDGNVGADGATVNLWTCNGSNSQKWNADANHNLHPQNYPGYCLNLHGNVAGNGTAINLWSCTGHNSQKWNVSGAWITGLDGTTNLNPQDYPGYCLNLHYNDAFDGGVINLWSCNSHNSKKWVRNADQTIRPKDYPNFCLNLDGNVASNGATINLWRCNGSNSQKWNADPSHNLHPQDYPDYCLNLHGNVGADGATINLWSCTDHNSQKWNVTAAPVGAASLAGDAVAQPLTTTTEVAAAPAVIETAAQPQKIFLPLVANNGVMAASTDAPAAPASEAAPQSAAVAATTALTLPLTAADPNAGGGSLGAAQPVTTTAPSAVITTTAPVSVPVTVDAAPVVTATGPVGSESAPVSVPVAVEAAPLITESVPVSVAAVVEATPVVSDSAPVTVPVVVDAASAVTATLLLTTTQPLTTAVAANPLAGTAAGGRGGLAVLALVGLAVVGSLLWQRQRMNYR